MNSNQKKPEILSPAGNFEKLKFACLYGADAVYCSLERFGMRAAAGNFTIEKLAKGVDFAHSMGKRVYLTLNTMPRSGEISDLERTVDRLKDVPIDAVIVADMGVFQTVRERLDCDIHISTQGANMNYLSCRMWHDMGAKRVVLARELSLEDIAQIRAKTPKTLELECFVHGAMCVSVSGRCMLSEFYTGRDANRGACTQPCRWIYHFAEEKREDEIMTAEFHQNEGTYIFGSKDMCLIEHIPELVSAGIDSFKIEGRMKSVLYTASVTNAYRMARDRYFETGDAVTFDRRFMREMEGVSHREYCTGYYFGHPLDEPCLAATSGYIGEKTFLATVISYDEKTGLALCFQRNKTVCGKAQALTPGKFREEITIEALYDSDMNPIESAPHPEMLFYMKADLPLFENTIISQ